MAVVTAGLLRSVVSFAKSRRLLSDFPAGYGDLRRLGLGVF